MKVQSKPAQDVRTAKVHTKKAKKASATQAVSKTVVSEISEDPLSGRYGLTASEITPRVRSALLTLVNEVEDLRRELEVTQNRLLELEQLADNDTLLPIPNRRAFVRELSRVISYAERYGVPASLLFFDVNNLKTVNDTYGHKAGDATLIHVAQTLQDNIRNSDIVGRLGGDEFGVILTHANDQQAAAKARFLSECISSESISFDNNEIVASASVGSYTFSPGETTVDILAKADEMMYANKKAFRARQAEVSEAIFPNAQ